MCGKPGYNDIMYLDEETQTMKNDGIEIVSKV